MAVTIAGMASSFVAAHILEAYIVVVDLCVVAVLAGAYHIIFSCGQ